MASDLASILGKGKSSEDGEEMEESEESKDSGGGDTVAAAKAVQRHLNGDPAKLARALKAFIELCEGDY
jgi:hypothetical protein